MILWNALQHLRQLPIGIQRAEHMTVRVLQHEAIAHLRRLRIHAANGLRDRRDNQQPTFLNRSPIGLRHPAQCPQFPCQYPDDRLFPLQKQCQHIPFKGTLKATHDAHTLVAHPRRPVETPHYRLRRHTPRRKKADFLAIQKGLISKHHTLQHAVMPPNNVMS